MVKKILEENMKFNTAWWGVQIMAETDIDEKILRDLYSIIPKEASSTHEDGTVRQITKCTCSCYSFTDEEIAKSKFVIQFD